MFARAMKLEGEPHELKLGHRYVIGDFLVGLESISKDGAALRIECADGSRSFTKALSPDVKLLTKRPPRA